MTKDEALKLAQKALSNRNAPAKTIYEALAAIQKALAQPDKNEFNPDYNTEAVLVEEMQRMAKRIEELETLERQTDPESAYQRGYLDGIGRDCPHCKDYKAMYIRVRDELAAEQQITQQQTARIVGLQDEIRNLTGEE